MSDSGFDLKRDGLGIGLFALGTFFAVLGGYAVLVAMRTGADLGSATGSGAVAQAWLAAVGVIPGLVLSGGIALVGARIWLSGRAKGVVRQVLAFAGLALGAAVLAGALSPSAGGRFGFATGGLVSEAIHPIAGVLCGVLATAAAVWFGWLRTTRGESLDEPTLVQNPDLPDLAFDDLGVSADEAAALIPEDFHRPAKTSRRQAQPPVHTPPASPYPEDVRRQGKIPAGARPLPVPPSSDASPDVQPVPPAAEGQASAATVYRWTAARTDRPVGAGEDLAAPPGVAAAFDAVESAPARGASEADPFALKEEDPLAQALEAIPRPSWEQSNLFVEEDEPVDAYGTPLTLVDALRRSQQEVASAFGEEAAIAQPLAAERVDGAAGIEQELEEELDEEDFDEEDSAEDELGDTEPELDPEEDLDAEVEAEEGSELEDEEEAELEEAAGLETDEELDEPLENEASEPDLEIPAAAPRAHEPALEPRAVSAPMLPFQAPAADAPARHAALDHKSEPAISALHDAAPAEREVILQPQPGTAGRASKVPLSSDARGTLIFEAGCLFLDRGRVAVSMLQREYSMDFDEACRVLDELQELGLIGPYLGGQRRDILLTREQWLERVAKV